jgi:hypothetical protein
LSFAAYRLTAWFCVRSRRCLLFASVCLAVAMLAGPARADQKHSAITMLTGTVSDALGRPLPGVSLTLESGEGRIIARATSDDHGAFGIAQPAAGAYSLRAQKEGFKPAAMAMVFPRDAGSDRRHTMESARELTLPVQASRIHPQNGCLKPATTSTR